MAINFISDVDKDINNFLNQYLDNHDNVPDIDSASLSLHKMQRDLYLKKLPDSKLLFDLQIRDDPYGGYVLVWTNALYHGDDVEKSRFANDSIMNMQERYSDNPFAPEKFIRHYKNKLKMYVMAAQTIGGKVIFPKNKNSVNVRRGCDPKIRDRFDLTLECIRRFYERDENKRQSPLYDVLMLDENKKFFDMFPNFMAFVKFFYLDAYINRDGTVKFFIGGDVFKNNAYGFDARSPFPKNRKEWKRLYSKQMRCVQKRNKQIYKALKKISIPAK